MTVDIDRKLLKWGNGYGIRLTAAEVAKLGVHAGAVVHAQVGRSQPVRNDLSKLALFHFGQPYDVKAILDEDALERSDVARRRRKPAKRSRRA